MNQKNKGFRMFDTIKHTLTHVDKSFLAEKFGYSNVEKFAQTKSLFLECSSMKEWFLKGHYDMVNSSLEFIRKLDFVLDKDILDLFLQESIWLKDKYTKLQEARIDIKTNFKRTSEPIHALAGLSHLRTLKFPITEDLLYLNKTQIMQKLQEFAMKHYKDSKGKLEF